MKLIKYFKQLRKKFSNYQPLIEILISKKAILGNLHNFQDNYPHLQFAPVLKSNAYGHGLVQVAKIIDQENIPFIVLDSLQEAMILRDNGINSRILIIGYTQAENINRSKLHHIAFAITSLEQLQIVAALNKRLVIHIKVDTGMHRQGLLPEQLNSAIATIKNSPQLKIEGLCSHLADADTPNSPQTIEQLAQWEKTVKLFKENFNDIKYFHIAATAGSLHMSDIAANVARLGIGLYGIDSSFERQLKLQPALKMQTIISSIKKLPAGTKIGYNGTHALEQDTLIATVPVGYYEGVDRRLSNCGYFTIHEKNCPLVGRVSMNISSIDISAVPQAKLNDLVTIINDKPNTPNSAQNIAKQIKAIPYEIVCHIPAYLRRTIIK